MLLNEMWAKPAAKYFALRIFLVPGLTQCFLLFFRQAVDFFAIIRATAFVGFAAGTTLNKQQMTIVVGAIGMGVTWVSTLVAMGYDFAIDRFTQPLVKNKILTCKP